MKNIINTTNISSVNFIYGRKGQFRVIVKCAGGFMVCSDCHDFDNNRYCENPAEVLSAYKKGALQTVQFKAEGTDHWLTVFARSGKKVILMDLKMMENITVGCVNMDWSNTNLYSQEQYKLVGATNWLSKVFVSNQEDVMIQPV
jgi:hypothetical protein